VVEKCGAETKEFLKGEPVTDLGAKRSARKVRGQIVKDDAEEIGDGTSAASKEIRENAKQAAPSRVRGAVARREE
jgi:hypothetical protein